MNDINKINSAREPSDYLNLGLLVSIMLKSKKLIVLISSIFITAAVFYALHLQNIYTSSILLKGKDGYSNQPSSGIAGLGSMVGFNIGLGEVDKVGLSLEILNSKDFFDILYQDDNFLIDLLAHDKYLEDSGKSVYDQGLVKIIKTRFELPSSRSYMDNIFPIELAQIIFLKKMLIVRSVDTGLVKIHYSHNSPLIAKKTLERVINDLDQYVKKRDLSKSNQALKFLNSTDFNFDSTSIRKVTSNLIEAEMKKIMLSSIDENYIFEILDSPRVSFFKTGPFRSSMVIFAGFASFIVSMILIFILFYFNKKLHFTILPFRFHLQDI